MPEGLIVKALSGFYYVKSDCGLVSCRARGKFRLDGVSPLVGDRVSFDMTEDGNGYVTAILPRKNLFIRFPGFPACIDGGDKVRHDPIPDLPGQVQPPFHPIAVFLHFLFLFGHFPCSSPNPFTVTVKFFHNSH